MKALLNSSYKEVCETKEKCFSDLVYEISCFCVDVVDFADKEIESISEFDKLMHVANLSQLINVTITAKHHSCLEQLRANKAKEETVNNYLKNFYDEIKAIFENFAFSSDNMSFTLRRSIDERKEINKLKICDKKQEQYILLNTNDVLKVAEKQISVLVNFACMRAMNKMLNSKFSRRDRHNKKR